METKANTTDTVKHLILDPMVPINDVCQEDYLNDSRKLGAAAKSSAKHDILTAK